MASNGNDHPINGSQRANAIETPDLAHWTLHDLRRSFSTGCARIGIEPFLIELMPNPNLKARPARTISTSARRKWP